MNKKIFFIFVLILLFLFNFKVFASGTCSPNGYTILTINGIFTSEDGARYNKNQLSYKFSSIYNNEPINFDYIHNQSHIVGLGDLVDVVTQGLFDEKSDYDLINMLNDASQKVTTQKMLLVAHSQGNFYSNNFYNKVASREGGVPSESIGLYSVATPASSVAGGGKYLTSDTDKVIAATVARFVNILPPNIHIPLNASDGNGHSFSDVYLKYKGDRIVSDIKASLDQLQENDEQDINAPCISVPELTALHKIKSVAYSVADKTAVFLKNSMQNIVDATARGIAWIFKSGNLAKNNLASVISGTDTNQPSLSVDAAENNSANENADNTQTQNETPPQVTQGENVSTMQTENTENLENQNAETVNKNPPNTNVLNPIGGGGARRGDTSNGTSSTNYGTNDGNVSPTIDITMPVITIIGDNPISINLNSVYTELGATATDNVDSSINVVTSGSVDPSVVGTYLITYTAKDTAGNIATTTRTVNVIDPTIPDVIPPVIVIIGDNPMTVIKNTNYVEQGANANDAIDGVREVTITGNVDTGTLGTYIITYTATDVAGNIATATRMVIVSNKKYIPKYKFGTDNGDGLNWQVWGFNGSNVYDWSDTYVNNYLKEQFKIQDYGGGYWCSQCLQRGIFNHDPQQGFESADVLLSDLENNPQNNMIDVTYDVVLQWDATGYSYTISHAGITDTSGHTNISNVNENMWVGWDGSFNNFAYFPSGVYLGASGWFPFGYTGGVSMITDVYPVYLNSGIIQSDQKKIISFDFDSLNRNVIGVIDENNHTVSATVPNATDVTNLIPSVTVSDKATINPKAQIMQDFSNPVTYSVTAEDGSIQNYTITVTKEALPSDTTPPVILKLSISPSPITGYAKIGDTLTLSITADAGGYTAKTITINNVPVTNFTDIGNKTYTATYTILPGDNDVKSGTIPASVILSDADGNSNIAYTNVVANNLKIDANVPTLVSAKVVTANSVEVIFSEDIDGNTVNTSGNEFTVSGHSVSAAHELNGVVTLTIPSIINSGESPSVTFSSTNFKDLAGNQATSPATVIATNSL